MISLHSLRLIPLPLMRIGWLGLWVALLWTSSGAMAESSSPIGSPFTLTAHDGSRFDSSRLTGKVVLIYFGFTHCPDICPMELANMGHALNALSRDKVAGVFITVDPARDTVERLAAYVPFFHSDLIGLTGTDEEIQRVASQYHVAYRQIGQGAHYTVEHPAEIYVLGPRGRVQALAPFGSTPEHLVRLVQGVIADVLGP